MQSRAIDRADAAVHALTVSSHSRVLGWVGFAREREWGERKRARLRSPALRDEITKAGSLTCTNKSAQADLQPTLACAPRRFPEQRRLLPKSATSRMQSRDYEHEDETSR